MDTEEGSLEVDDLIEKESEMLESFSQEADAEKEEGTGTSMQSSYEEDAKMPTSHEDYGKSEVEAGAIVELVSKEGNVHEVPIAVARMSALVCNAIDEEDDEDDEEDSCVRIFVPNVKSVVLSKILEYCRFYTNIEPMTAIQSPLESYKLETLVQPWYHDFVQMHLPLLYEVVMASNYMDIQPLIALCSIAVNLTFSNLDEHNWEGHTVFCLTSMATDICINELRALTPLEEHRRHEEYTKERQASDARVILEIRKEEERLRELQQEAEEKRLRELQEEAEASQANKFVLGANRDDGEDGSTIQQNDQEGSPNETTVPEAAQTNMNNSGNFLDENADDDGNDTQENGAIDTNETDHVNNGSRCLPS